MTTAATKNLHRLDCIDPFTGFVVSTGWDAKRVSALHDVTDNAAEIASTIICLGFYETNSGVRFEPEHRP